MTFFPNVRHPAIVSPAQRDLRIRSFSALIEKDAWIKNLDVDAQFIHVPDPCADVCQIARRHCRAHVASNGCGFFIEIFFAERKTE